MSFPDFTFGYKKMRLLRKGLANGLRYLRVGGRGFCSGAGKTRSEENA
jgi:hypothetical protein